MGKFARCKDLAGTYSDSELALFADWLRVNHFVVNLSYVNMSARRECVWVTNCMPGNWADDSVFVIDPLGKSAKFYDRESAQGHILELLKNSPMNEVSACTEQKNPDLGEDVKLATLLMQSGKRVIVT